MNRKEIHQRALLAAAKATFSAAALGCGGPHEPAGPSARAHSVVTVPPEQRSPGARPPSPLAATTPQGSSCLGSSPGPYSKAQVDCCALVVKNQLPPYTSQLPTLSAEQSQCCQLVVSASDAHLMGRGPDLGVSRSEAYRCCSFPGPMPDGPTCSPWGPPMPPPMDLALLDELMS